MEAKRQKNNEVGDVMKMIANANNKVMGIEEKQRQ